MWSHSNTSVFNAALWAALLLERPKVPLIKVVVCPKTAKHVSVWQNCVSRCTDARLPLSVARVDVFYFKIAPENSVSATLRSLSAALWGAP